MSGLQEALAQPVDLAKVGEVGVWGEDLDEREDLFTNRVNPVKNLVKREEKNA